MLVDDLSECYEVHWFRQHGSENANLKFVLIIKAIALYRRSEITSNMENGCAHLGIPSVSHLPL